MTPTGALGTERHVNSFIAWMGGKSRMAKTICALLPEHRVYVEVFGGAAWVLFRKESSRVEIYNDLDGRLVALFRSVKHHPQELLRELDLLVPSREMFELLRDQPGLTEIQRAARFYYVLTSSYGAKCETPGSWKVRPPRFHLESMVARVEEIRERLSRVYIERDDFAGVIHRYDGPDTCLFVDPPYLGCEEYRVPFTQEDHERLRENLAAAQGHWLLTYNDHADVRAMYEGQYRYAVEAPYTLSGEWKPGEQLIITNYELTRTQRRRADRKLTKIPGPRRGGSKGDK